MPYSALKSCSYPGCTVLVRHGLCDAHKHTQISRHEPDSQRLYGTARWHMLRRLQLTRSPWCEDCLKADVYEAATDVDHVEQHKGDQVKFYTGALQSLCHSCHSAKTAREVFGKGRGG